MVLELSFFFCSACQGVIWILLALADGDSLCQDAIRECGAIHVIAEVLCGEPLPSALEQHIGLEALAVRAVHVLAKDNLQNQQLMCRLGCVRHLAALLIEPDVPEPATGGAPDA